MTLAVFDIEYEGLRRREATSGNPALRESVIGLDAMLTNAGRALFGYLVEPEVDVRAAENVGCFEVDLGFNANYGMARRASLAGVEQYIDPQPAVVMKALGLRASDLADESEVERPEGWVEGVIPFLLRLNGRRVIEAECDPNPYRSDATPAKAVASIKEEIESIPLPEGYTMRWVGEGEIQGEAIGNLMKFVPITIFLILVILLLLFNSWRKVILILLCFPFVFCGITPSLLLSGQPMTFMAIIGMLGLIGMMVKNAIVLVDEINRLQTEEHATPYTAVVEATVSRVRPVLMASLTTIVGMIPLVGDPMYSSMAITIMGGLTVGTIITLILLPLFYATLFRIRKPANM